MIDMMISNTHLTADELLAGATLVFDITVPSEVLRPQSSSGASPATSPAALPQDQELVVQLRPLTIGTFQLIMKATQQDPGLIPLLMIKESLVNPQLSLDQVRAMPLGMVNFFIGHIRHISGLGEKKT